MLKYVNFTKLDHLESILINVSAFLEENYYFTSKNASKFFDSAEKSCTTKSNLFLAKSNFFSRGKSNFSWKNLNVFRKFLDNFLGFMILSWNLSLSY